MGSPWPAPLPDEKISGGGPNYALRRAAVLLVVVALIALVAAWWMRRGDDDAADGDGSGNEWNTVVVQDEDTGEVTLIDAEGVEIESFRTDLTGLLDVGLPGRLVVGVAGEPATDGLGIIDLDVRRGDRPRGREQRRLAARHQRLPAGGRRSA